MPYRRASIAKRNFPPSGIAMYYPPVYIEHMNNTDRNQPHTYKATGTPKWRTCALCGQGANATVHRPVKMTGRGRGRPQIGDRVELRLATEVLAAVDKEAIDLGWKRAELLRWIITDRYADKLGLRRAAVCESDG
jgi:hypothetical protein